MKKKIQEEDEFISLKVGGRKFWTFKNTLTNRSGFFRTMFCGNFVNKKDEEGFISIERDGELFEIVLNCLRDQSLSFKNLTLDQIESLLSEADFYLIEDLKIALEDRKYEIEKIFNSLLYQMMEESRISEKILLLNRSDEKAIHKLFEIAKILYSQGLYKEAHIQYCKCAFDYQYPLSIGRLFILQFDKTPMEKFTKINPREWLELFFLIEKNIDWFEKNQEVNTDIQICFAVYLRLRGSKDLNSKVEELLNKAAETGESLAHIFVISLCLNLSRNLMESIKFNFEHLKKAVEKNNLPALFLYHKTYLLATDLQNKQQHIDFFQKMIDEKDDGDAYSILAEFYDSKKQYEKAWEYLKKAEERKSINSYLLISYIYEKGPLWEDKYPFIHQDSEKGKYYNNLYHTFILQDIDPYMSFFYYRFKCHYCFCTFSLENILTWKE